MKTLRLLLPLFAFAGLAAAQTNQPVIPTSLLNVAALRQLICGSVSGLCGDNWLDYVPSQAPNGTTTTFTIPVAAAKVEVYVAGVLIHTQTQLPAGFTPQYSWAASGGSTTITFTGPYVPAATDNVLVRATK